MNAIKDSIKSGRTVVGITVTPNIDMSILADAGYDFLLFEPSTPPGRSSPRGSPPISRTTALSEHAQETAAHESSRITKLYDRTKERLTHDEVERIRL